jgi:membrane protein
MASMQQRPGKPTPAGLPKRSRGGVGAPQHRKGVPETTKPSDIPARGWKQILGRTFKEFGEDEIPMISAGVTYYTLLALFPGVAALTSLYGLFADVGEAQRNLNTLSAILPGGAITLIGDQMRHVAAVGTTGLSLALVGGLLVSIWSANGAIKAMITGLNIAYEQQEQRKFIAKTLVSLAFTLGYLAFALLAIAMVAARPVVAHYVGPTAGLIYTVAIVPVLVVLLGVGLALLYRYGPNRPDVKWRWISWGSAVATIAWMVMSAAFSFYAAKFGTFNKTYGPLGAAIGFMVWAWLSSMVILLGAELNCEIERQAPSVPSPPGEGGVRG